MIEKIIYDNYHGMKEARKPTTKRTIAPPDEENWSPSEVSMLINCIVRDCNRAIANKYFDVNNRCST